MVLRDELRASIAEQVSGTVADVEKAQLTTSNGRHDDCASHPLPLGVLLGSLEHCRVGLLARTLQAIDIRALVAVLSQDAGDGLRCNGACGLAGGVTAHAVAYDQQGVQARLVAPDDYCVLVLLSFEAGISPPC